MNIRRSLLITFGTRYAELVIALISSIILARLLSPEDFGIYSIAASIAMLGYLLRNFGVGQFIIQVEQLSDDKIRAAFTLTLAVSWGIGLLLALSAPLLANIYEEPGIKTALLFLSVNFLILPFGAVSEAMLRRKMEFGKLAVIQLSSALTGLVVGVGAAMLEARYMSIVWAGNASTVTTILLTLVYRPPGLPWLPGLKQVRQVMSFGLKVSMVNLIPKGSDSITELFIGKVHGLHDLGIYSRAYGTFMLFEHTVLEAIRPVVLPHLSEANRNKTSLGPAYLHTVNFIAMFMLPFFVFLYLNAAEVLHVLYGDQWGDAVPILQVLCLGGMFLAPTAFFEQFLVAIGRPGQALVYQAGYQVARLGAFVLLVTISLEAAAVAIVIGAAAKAVLVLWLANRHFQLRLAEFFRIILPAALTASAIAVAVVLLSTLSREWTSEFLRLLAAALLTLGVWLTALLLFRHPIMAEIHSLVRKRRQAGET